MLPFLELHELSLYLSPPHALHGSKLLVSHASAEVRAFPAAHISQDLFEGRSLNMVMLPAV